MKLHIFNPEHDMALACNAANFTLPHTIHQFKASLAFLPALWADDGDLVLVDDVLFALKSLSRLGIARADVLFVTAGDIKDILFTAVQPWGWDKPVCSLLRSAGVGGSLLPSDAYLDLVRHLSSRRQTAAALGFLRAGLASATCGESHVCRSLPEVQALLRRHGGIVVKALWSSSGRGVRYANGSLSSPLSRWIERTVARQGGVSVEPYYNKVKDFALEFSLGGGSAVYCGLSLFHTVRGNYAGNVVATEADKRGMLSRYLPLSLVDTIRDRLALYLSSGRFAAYSGPVGVDMMVVAGARGGAYLLHPCVEINVRRTMGHVANSLNPAPADPPRLMRIERGVNFRLKFSPMGNYYVKTL